MIEVLYSIVGPYMLLEYCELGQLREWLIEHRNKVTDDLITDFCKMVHGVSKGMEALEQKGVGGKSVIQMVIFWEKFR
jgi:hypothetical protein